MTLTQEGTFYNQAQAQEQQAQHFIYQYWTVFGKMELKKK